MYDKEEILNECIKAIKENKLCFFEDIGSFVQPDLSSLYNWKFNELESIKSELSKNKVESKRKLRRNWEKEDAAPALQLAVYKLMATDEEIDKLTMQKTKGDINISQMKPVHITPNGNTEQSNLADI